MTTERLHLLISVELDRDALADYREKLEAKGSLDLYPGEPREWRSMVDFVDLIDENVLVRAELLDVTEGPPPLELVEGAQKDGGVLRRLWRRFTS